MIVDTSAIVAVILEEPEAQEFIDLIVSNNSRLSAATFVECSAVINRNRHSMTDRQFDELLQKLGITIEPFTPAQATLARQAYSDFGRGSGHPAQLNFGDCFSYALAKDLNEPLLFKGEDFAKTDVKTAS